MAEGENNFSEDYADLQTPSETDPAEQGRIAAEMKADIHEANIVVDKPKQPAGAQNTLPQNDQQNIAAAEQAARMQQINQLSQMETASDSGPTKIKGELASGPFLRILNTIPAVGGLLSRFRSAKTPKDREKILRRLQRVLKIAKPAAAIVDGFRTWAQVFAATWETIIMIVIMIFLFLPWMAVYIFFGDKMPGAAVSKVIGRTLKKIDPLLKAYRQAMQKEKERSALKARLNALRNQQIKNQPAANEPMAGQKAA